METDAKAVWWACGLDVQQAVVVGRWRHRIVRFIAVVTVAGGCVVLALANPGATAELMPAGAVSEVASLDDIAAGCGGYTIWPAPPSSEIGWAEPGLTLSWRLSPPVSGNFSPVPWSGSNVLNPEVRALPTREEAVSLLWHGWTVVWYRRDAPADTVSHLMALGESLPLDAHVLISPWPLDADTTWRAGRVILVTGWSATQPCLELSAEVLAKFRSHPSLAPGFGVPLTVPGPKAAVVTGVK
jgi:hypothetical protein